ncbi:MAG: HIT domain-containing protein [Candidatus Omnitrophica bacterium]|nr:HIT domain-containing protein [Candidatus Omnitrophota bacterium]
MDKLWAPWRRGYILHKPGRTCFICRIKKSSQDSKLFVLKRSRNSFAVLNRFPYNNGHVMVIPNRHVGTLEKLSQSELIDLVHLTTWMMSRLQKVMKPRGMNLGINFGRIGGAGVPGHLHIHVVPRWSGDTNFMPVIGNTKVISESLQSVYRRLKRNSP